MKTARRILAASAALLLLGVAGCGTNSPASVPPANPATDQVDFAKKQAEAQQAQMKNYPGANTTKPQ